MECPVFNQLPQKFNFYRPIGFPTSRFLAFRTKCDKYLLPLKKLGDLLGVAKIHTVLLHHVLQEGQPVPGVGFGYCYFKSEMATGWMHVSLRHCLRCKLFDIIAISSRSTVSSQSDVIWGKRSNTIRAEQARAWFRESIFQFWGFKHSLDICWTIFSKRSFFLFLIL